jgi:hypothetical protein
LDILNKKENINKENQNEIIFIDEERKFLYYEISFLGKKKEMNNLIGKGKKN